MTHIRYSSSDEMRSIMKKYITLLQQFIINRETTISKYKNKILLKTNLFRKMHTTSELTHHVDGIKMRYRYK